MRRTPDEPASAPGPDPAPAPPATGPDPAPPPAPAIDPQEFERLRADRDEWQREREQIRAEREETARWRRAVEGRLPQPPPPQEPDLERLWFENPRAAAELVEARVTGKLEQRYQQDQAAQQQQATAREFFSSVYESHPELAGEDNVMAFVFQRDSQRLLTMRVPEAREALAKGMREEILRLEKRAASLRTAEEGTTPPPRSRAVVEGGSGPRLPSRRDAGEAQGGPQSLSELLRERRDRRSSSTSRPGRR